MQAEKINLITTYDLTELDFVVHKHKARGLD